MLKAAQQNTIPFNNLTKKINYQLLREPHNRRGEKKSRYPRSDSELESILNNHELFNILVSKKEISDKKTEIQKLINKGADVTFEVNKKPMLHWAIKINEPEIIDLLLQAGAGNNLSNKDSTTLLMFSRQLGNPDIITALERAIPHTSQSVHTANSDSDNEEPTQKRSRLSSEYPVPKTGLKSSLHGTVYQLKILMLFLKKAMDKKYSFSLSTENEDADKFDDLVLKYKKEKEISEKYIFLQAKHKQELKDKEEITVGNLLSTDIKEPFMLGKYFLSFLKIKKNFVVDSDFFIFTNNKFSFDKNMKIKSPTRGYNKDVTFYLNDFSANCILKDILDTGNQEKYYKINFSLDDFKKYLNRETENLKDINKEINKLIRERNGNLDEEIKLFFDKLVFAVGQYSELKLDTILSKSLEDKYNLFDSELAVSYFEKNIINWLKDKKGIWYTDEKANDLFNSLKIKINTILSIPYGQIHYEELKSYNINFVKNQLEVFIDSKKHVLHVYTSSTPTLLSSIKIARALENSSDYKKQGSFSFIKLKHILIPEIQKKVIESFKSGNCNLLAIDLQQEDIEEKQIEELYEKLSNLQNKNKIILISTKEDNYLAKKFKDRFKNGNEFTDKEDKTFFSDLSKKSKEILLRKSINFQGVNVVLNQLMTPESPITELLPLSSFLEEKPLEIGKKLPISNGYDEAFFIPRTFQSYIEIDKSILDDKKELHDLLAYSEEEFKKMCQEHPTRNIHYLKREPGQRLVWRESQGDLTTLRQYFDKKHHSYIDAHHPLSYSPKDLKNFLQQAKHQKVILIADTAGMGKSTVITHLSKQIKETSPTYWVVRIDLNDHTDDLKAQTNEKMEVVEFLSEKLLKLDSTLEKGLFKYLLGEGKVVLMLDGFDEISPSYKETVIDLLQALKKTPVEQLWVTTRLHLRQALENNLQQISYTLCPFSEKNQVEFLTRFWRQQLTLQEDSQNRLEIYSKILIKNLAESTNDKGKELTGIPLQTRMLAELFQAKVSDNLKINNEILELPGKLELIGLYEIFIKEKYRIHQKDKLKKNLSKPGVEGEQSIIFKIFKSDHQQLAIEVIFDKNQAEILGHLTTSREFSDQDLFRIGLVQIIDSHPHFIHRTFAEYFVSCFLIENLSKIPVKNFLLEKIFIQDEYQNLRNFLNGFFSKELPGNNLLKIYGKRISEIWLNRIHADENFLTIAAKENNEKILLFFLESLKEHPETLKSIIFNNEITPLQIAASHGHREFFEVFLSFYQDKENSWPGTIKNLVLNKDNEGVSILQKAAINYQLKFIRWLLDYIKNKVEPKSPGILNKLVVSTKNYGYIPLHLAIQEGQLDVVKVLINHGANIEATNTYNETPLHIATLLGFLEIVKLLIANGANIEATDEDKTPPLHMAVEEGHFEVVKVLIINGANTNAADENESTPLHIAAEEGYLELVKVLIANGANIEAIDKYNWTPLHWATQEGHLEVVKVLIENEANIDASDENKATPLHVATEERRLEIIKVLIERGANIEATDENKTTPLHLAAEEGHIEVVKFLIAKEANIEATDEDKTTSLHIAALNGHLEVVKVLIANGANIEAIDEDKRTPLHRAAKEGYLEVVKVLIANGANIEAIDEDKRTPLHRAAKEGYLEVVKVLIANGANIAVTDKYNWTPLHAAAEEGHLEVVNTLIAKGANIEATDRNKATPLHMAAEEGHLEVIKMLVSKGVNIEATDEDKTTPLHLAAEEGHLEVVKVLISKGANIDPTDEDKTTPLHLAAEEGHFKIVKLLIVKGANIEAIDKDNWTPLQRAAQYGRLKAVKVLIDNKANIKATDGNKVTPLHRATKYGRFEVVKVLIAGGANIEATDKYNWTPLHWAAQEGHIKVIKVLISEGANIEATDKNNWTPLHWAVEEGHIEVVKFLINQGANIEATDKNNWTPLHLVSEEGHLNVVNVLIEQGANIEATDKNNRTPLYLAAQREHWAITVTLLNRGAKISDEQCNLLKQHAEYSDYENKPQLLQLIEQRLLTSSIARLIKIRAQSESLGLEAVASADCLPRQRNRRELSFCTEGEKRDLFPYEPLGENALVEQCQAARLYGHLALADAWQHGESPDNLLRYQRYLGEILEEGEANQSPREQRLVREHYQQALSFFQNHPKPTLLEAQADDFEPLAGHSVLLKNGQQSLLVFNEGPRYQLYSPDFNYQQRFHTKPGVSWAEMSAFIQAFFQWKTGSRDCHVLTLQELPSETLKSLREAPFWKPEALAPDSVLLAREHSRGIEGIPAEVVRELIRVNGQVVEVSALHADFFQLTAGIQLRVEHLHVVLGELTTEQRQALVQVVRKYQWSADSTLLESLDAEARPLFADYQQQVMTELKTAETLTPERLAEFSWQAMQQAFNRAEIPAELTQQALTHLKALQATSAKRAWAKGMATQTLFFLPDMIRAANTGQVDGLVRMGGMLAADSTVNHLYGNLLERLTPTLSEARLGLLRKLPITSPVFKALTVYSIVELTKQLQSLPPDSEQRNTIKHRLGEQYVTVGLMVAELFGWELGPLWVALIAEQLIFEAVTFRKENQLDIPFWEAFIMSLGFEQAKLQNIFEERQLVELNLAIVNNLNSQIQPPYGLVLVRVPTLGPLTWNDIDESQVPSEIKALILKQPDPSPSLISGTAIREAGGFQQLFEHISNVQGVDASGRRARGRLVKSYWKRGNYTVQATPITVHWTPSGRRSHQEDNRFLKQLTIPQRVNSTFERLVSVAGSGYQAVVTHSPIQITGEGLAALYAVKQPPATTASQKNLFLGFDPREGDISLEMSSSGWKALTGDYRGAPPSTSFTVQVGPKGYPPMILFQPNLGVLRVEDKSRRLHGDYFISSDSTPFYLYDDTLTTRIAISPPSDRPIGFMVRSYDLSMLQLQTWSPKRSQTRPELPLLPSDRSPVALKKALQALLPQQISLLHLPNKQYLQLMLEQQQIAGVLTLAAEQVEVLFAKGQDAYQSGIFMTSSVTNFTVTLLGHLQIMQGNAYLFFIGEIPDNADLVRYSKLISSPHSPLYQLELSALQPVLESLSRPNPQEIQFSTPGLNYAWVAGMEHPSVLKIIGIYQGQQAQLLLEHHETTFSQLEEQKPRPLVVDHYTPQATLESQLLLKQVIPGGGESHLAYLDGRCDSLLFQSAEDYSVIHRFPAQQTLTLNGINYQVIGKQLYAMGAPNGVINGEQLIRYRTATRRMAIRLNSSLAESTLSLERGTLTINQLTLHHLPHQTPIVLGEQAFPLRALKESVHRYRHRRALPSAKPLASGAAQNKPWSSQLIKQVVTLLEWPALFSSWGSSTNQKPTILDSGQPTPQGLQALGEYTAGHLQGGLQLADLLIRKITGERHQHSGTCVTNPLTEAEARLASLQQQWASFSSHDNLAANPYRGHQVDTLSTPQWTTTPINSD